MNIHCIEIFSQSKIFEQLALALKKTVLLWKFSLQWIYFLYSGFLSTCACHENRVSPEIFHCTEYIFYHLGFLSNLRLPWKKQSCYENFRYSEYTFYIQDFYQLALDLKTEFPLKIFTVLNIFFTFRSFEQLALALKNRGCPEFTVQNIYFLLFRIFEQLALALKKTELPWKFSLQWIHFLYSGFLTTCAWPENRVSPEIFHCIEYIFYYSGFLSNCPCPEKQSCPENFHWLEYTFYMKTYGATCACPEKQSFPGIFHCIQGFFKTF